MPDFEMKLRSAHDQGRMDTREVLRSGEMPEDYTYKLVKGSFGLTFWVVVIGSIWLVFGSHWSFWIVALLFLPAWMVVAVVWCGIQTAGIMIIWHARGLGPFAKHKVGR
jgi:hypothetical protein